MDHTRKDKKDSYRNSRSEMLTSLQMFEEKLEGKSLRAIALKYGYKRTTAVDRIIAIQRLVGRNLSPELRQQLIGGEICQGSILEIRRSISVVRSLIEDQCSSD